MLDQTTDLEDFRKKGTLKLRDCILNNDTDGCGCDSFVYKTESGERCRVSINNREMKTKDFDLAKFSIV